MWPLPTSLAMYCSERHCGKSWPLMKQVSFGVLCQLVRMKSFGRTLYLLGRFLCTHMTQGTFSYVSRRSAWLDEGVGKAEGKDGGLCNSLLKLAFSFVFKCMCVCYGCALHGTWWWSKDIVELVFSFCFYTASGNWTQATRPVQSASVLAEPSCQPES